MKKRIGIWMDFREAFIIELQEKDASIAHVSSEIEDFHPKGGSRMKGAPWGPMDKISEPKYLERRKHQEKDYYQRLMKATEIADELYIFGPAQAKEGLKKAINDNTNFKPSLKGVETADSMTENQRVAKVRAFFGVQ